MTKYNIVNNISYKEIESKEEYDKELALFNEELKKFTMSYLLKNRTTAYKEFSDIIDRCEGIGLFDKEYCNQLRKRIIDGINNSSLREQIKNKLRKRGL